MWWIFSSDDFFARLERWHEETSGAVQALDSVLLLVFLFANLLVLAFALRPSGAVYFLPKSAFRKKLMQDMNIEQMQMPRLFATLRRAVAHAEQARATRWLAVCYALLFAVPTWWIFWAQRHIGGLFKEGCLASTQALQKSSDSILKPCRQSRRSIA